MPPDLNSRRLSSDEAGKEYRLGSALVICGCRALRGPAGEVRLQPQVFRVFSALAGGKGDLMSREDLFNQCWGPTAVGDDSLNRAISIIRWGLQSIGADDVILETVPRAGYRIVVAAKRLEKFATMTRAMQKAIDSLQLGMPAVDAQLLATLRKLLATGDHPAIDWGLFALLLRKAVEYASATACADYVEECRSAARRAFKKDPSEPHAQLAMLTLPPLFGNWSQVRRGLNSILSHDQNNVQTRHEIAVLEMATGRPSVAAPIIEQLIAEDGLAAAFAYKRIYHLWTLGDLHACEMAMSRAMQLWPRHPAIWNACYWVLLSTGRAKRAVRMAQSGDGVPGASEEGRDFVIETAHVIEQWQSDKLSNDDLAGHVSRTLAWSEKGPPQAVFSFMSLCVLRSIDVAFQVARGYFLGEGQNSTPLRSEKKDPSITDQDRRVTQILFIPVAKLLRSDDRFLTLCNDLGLVAHWEDFDFEPDFRWMDGAVPSEQGS